MKKMFFRYISWLVSIAICFSCLTVNALATGNDAPSNEHILTPDDFLGSPTFEPITREEYIASKAEHEGRTYNDIANELDQKIEATIAAIPAPTTWDGDTTVSQGDGTHIIYGRVINYYTHDSGVTIGSSVQAVIVASHYGRTWLECDQEGRVLLSGIGQVQFDGSVIASIISTTQLRMVLEGTFTVTTTVGVDFGFNLEIIENSYSVGNTIYYYEDIYSAHVEKLVQSGG